MTERRFSFITEIVLDLVRIMVRLAAGLTLAVADSERFIRLRLRAAGAWFAMTRPLAALWFFARTFVRSPRPAERAYMRDQLRSIFREIGATVPRMRAPVMRGC